MTPGRNDDATKFKLTLRDALALLAGCLAMYGAQVGAQWSLRSDIRDLKTAFENYQQRQTETNGAVQRQIDEWRALSKLAHEKATDNQAALARIEGFIQGSGMKVVKK